MLDQPDPRQTKTQSSGPPLDFQEHLARLEAAGLLTPHRSADRQGHRAASAGALAIPGRPARRRAPRIICSPTSPTAKAAATTSPVAIGALAASARNLCHRHGAAGRGHRQGLDASHRQSDRARRGDRGAVPGGRHQRRCAAQTGRRPETSAGADLDARL